MCYQNIIEHRTHAFHQFTTSSVRLVMRCAHLVRLVKAGRGTSHKLVPRRQSPNFPKISKDAGVLQSWLKLKEEVMAFPWVNHGVFLFSDPKSCWPRYPCLAISTWDRSIWCFAQIYIYILTNPYWSACLHNSTISDRWHPTWIPIPPFCHSLQARAAQPSPIPCRNYVRKGLVRM